MALLTTAKEPGIGDPCAATAAAVVVPACMFAPDPGFCEEDVPDGEGSEDGEGTHGESEDHLDFSSKLVLVSPSGDQYDSLLRQLRERMDEGCGETIYVVGMGSGPGGVVYRACHALTAGSSGLGEKDMEASVATVTSLCEQIEADLIFLRERAEAGGKIRDYLIRRRVDELDFLEVRYVDLDRRRSTLLGVLTHGELDNGRGFARQKLFRHKHEMESGRTSSVGNDILGFDQEGQVVNKPDSHGGSLDWTKICERSSKVITFIDLAGHEKYLKTTVFGMTGHLPDFCMLMVVSKALCSPIAPCQLAVEAPPIHRKIPVLVQNKDDVIVTASNFSSESPSLAVGEDEAARGTEARLSTTPPSPRQPLPQQRQEPPSNANIPPAPPTTPAPPPPPLGTPAPIEL
ncbi:hypothetical protein CRUP_029948 [Coryphaenoides rupestris]|nr:hypothetical protein CRUP_029948 [Coryphaenoides rupestris]